jgi:hypothetical protein
MPIFELVRTEMLLSSTPTKAEDSISVDLLVSLLALAKMQTAPILFVIIETMNDLTVRIEQHR